MKNYEKNIIKYGRKILASHIFAFPEKEFRIVSLIAKKNKIISYSFNNPYKTDTFQHEFCQTPFEIYRHAETTVIKKAKSSLKKSTLEGLTIYVIRLKWQDDTKKRLIFGNAKPCCGCFRCIDEHKLSNVIYSLDSQEFQKEVIQNGEY